MAKEPVHPDIMDLLLRLARKGPEWDKSPPCYNLDALRERRIAFNEARRARFNAAFNTCASMGKDHPDLALQWLDALKQNQNWRRIKHINALSADIVQHTMAQRQRSLF